MSFASTLVNLPSVAEVRPALRVLKACSVDIQEYHRACGRGSTRFEGTESLSAARLSPRLVKGGRGSTRFEGTERYSVVSVDVRPCYVAEVRPALRVLKDEAVGDIRRACQSVAEVRPALRVLKAVLDRLYAGDEEEWQRFDPL